MSHQVVPAATGQDEDTAHLARLGYRQELRRVLGLFDNFSIAFSYLSPMVGVYSLFVLGVGAAGPRYIWLMIPVVGCIYGLALLVTVASVDTGIVGYLTSLLNNVFGTHFNGTGHGTVLIVTVAMIAIQTMLNTFGAKVMGRVSRIGVYVETIGTFGVAIALGIVGFHHGFGFLFSSQGAEHAGSNPLGVDFGGNWLVGAALVAVLAHVYIFYGFESAGDVAEETKQASRMVPRAMRSSLLYGGI